ncbi:hypothetical protein BOTBODRAFT_175390 [Botryobasidium botryosum FD-172 SS1]|uniref:Phytase A n=1 Tax=Botryobasidium botryosum (strain FD-172 SS1) TaxID=930990 RepID=A0A067MP57_BOTB1|nr:hypothetical protein BOTBODRAFT_175390 [Botryobasidium botryosum FD-172 SS1]
MARAWIIERETIALLVIPLAAAQLILAAPHVSRRDTAPTVLPSSIGQNLGQYSPYFNVATYTPFPTACSLTQVNILERHGARYPTGSASKLLKATIKKLQKDHSIGKDTLVKLGAEESHDAGGTAYQRYGSFLATSGKDPFVCTTAASRCVDSAANWTQGLQEASHGSIALAPPLVFPEKNFNNTLDNHNCPAYSEDASTQILQDLATRNFPPTTSRLNSYLNKPVLDDLDTANLMEMCAFESVDKSPFCDLFQTEEWPLFEYYADLDKFYGTGYGNALGPIQGVGYVNELIARLTGNPVSDGTNTNRTLTSDPTTFPFDRPLYADFSHDSEIAAITSALGLFREPGGAMLSTTTVDPKRAWVFSRISPFAGRMVVERLRCGGEVKVRILVDDAVQKLEFCEGVTSDGLCPLAAFVQSQSFATSNGNGKWGTCFTS